MALEDTGPDDKDAAVKCPREMVMNPFVWPSGGISKSVSSLHKQYYVVN